VRAVVRAGARLHLGFLDLNGSCGRRFGSIGVALEEPRCTVMACPAPAGAPPAAPEPVRAILDRLGPALGGRAVAVELIEAIPPHAGLGAGTQLGLAVALAAARATGRPLPIRELARWLGRGERSGVGVAAFEGGGLVIDAGHPADDGGAGPAAGDARPPEPPPVIFQHPLPDDWRFVLARPRAPAGLSGPAERRAFAALPPMDAARVGRICRLTLMQVVPAVLAGDIRGFGAGITEIQATLGEYFAPCQGGRYATRAGSEAAELALAEGAHGVGQSSWGPTVFALVLGAAAAEALAGALRARLGGRLAWVGVSRARNRGAACEELP
jgi:beta-ribofuranosylaminobenzene 5'-phosphate synthase